METKGKKAVIVGGASGMARASAELLSDRGAAVAILDRPQSEGAEVAAALGGTFHACDVTDADATEAAIDAAVEALGGSLHISVNTAGGGIASERSPRRGHTRSRTSAPSSSSTSSARSTSAGSRPRT